MDKEGRRRQLVECAKSVFAKKGYHEASIDDVIRAAGVARGTFYLHFESKRTIFREVLEELFQRIWSSVRPITVGADEDPRAQIVANLASLCAVLEEDEDVGRILLGGTVGLDPEAHQALAGFTESCRTRLARALRKGQELGIVREGDTTVLAISIMGIMKEYFTQRLLETKPPGVATFLVQVHRFFQAGWLREEKKPRRRAKA